MSENPSTSPERGAIKQCIAYCFGKMWANRGSNYLPERVDTAAESELAALEALVAVKDATNLMLYEENAALDAAVVAIRTQLTAEVKENADLRAQLAAARPQYGSNSRENYALHDEIPAATPADADASKDRLNRIAESE